jgi:hypothetical protein
MINSIYITWIVYTNINELCTYWRIIHSTDILTKGCIDNGWIDFTEVENHNLIVTPKELTN